MKPRQARFSRISVDIFGEDNLTTQSPIAGGTASRAHDLETSIFEAAKPWAWLSLRAATGLLLVPHGMQKLFGMFGGGGLSGTAKFLESVGYPSPELLALLIGLVEVFCGLLLAVGLFTRLAALPVVVFMIFAASFHLANGLFWTAKGFEYPVLWGLCALFFLVNGGGAWSVDAKLRRAS